MDFLDSHCHIHSADYQLDLMQVIEDATSVGVKQLLCVGCDLADSQLAVGLANKHENIWATIGIHPHESDNYVHDHHALQQFRDLASSPKVVAVGETGLDYYYNHSTAENQKKMLRFQMDLAKQHSLPMVFHIREAFDDFWQIFDEYSGIQGVVHSFTAYTDQLDQILSRGLFVGLNGIVTFTKDPLQLKAIKSVPLDRLLLETDSPYLTPVPYRGTICQPKHLLETAKYLAGIRGETLEQLATATTKNSQKLFLADTIKKL